MRHLLGQGTDAIVTTEDMQFRSRRIFCCELCAQFLIATGMVPMVMGRQDAGQLDVVLTDGRQNGIRIDGINDCCVSCGVIDKLYGAR